MSRDTYKYRIEITANVHMTAIGVDRFLNTRQLEERRVAMNDSFKPGGINFHADEPIVSHVSRLRLIRQSTGDVVSGCTGPLFEVA